MQVIWFWYIAAREFGYVGKFASLKVDTTTNIRPSSDIKKNTHLQKSGYAEELKRILYMSVPNSTQIRRLQPQKSLTEGQDMQCKYYNAQVTGGLSSSFKSIIFGYSSEHVRLYIWHFCTHKTVHKGYKITREKNWLSELFFLWGKSYRETKNMYANHHKMSNTQMELF